MTGRRSDARRRGRLTSIALSAGLGWLGAFAACGAAEMDEVPAPGPAARATAPVEARAAAGAPAERSADRPVDPEPIAAPLDDSLRLDQVQWIGTHNSYHLAPDATATAVIRSVAPAEAEANDYSHRPLREQLDRLRLRLFELDLYLDPQGGLYRRPLAHRLAEGRGAQPAPFDPLGRLEKPGVKILHSPDFDYRTTVYTLGDALRTLAEWSDERPGHLPVFVLLELKSDSFSPTTRPPAWDAAALRELERELAGGLGRRRLLAPADVRGDAATLRDAVRGRGWPTVRAARGKFVLLLDNEDRVRDAYASDDYLQGRSSADRDDAAGRPERLLFSSVPAGHPQAAWMKRNDPVGSYDEIRALVRDGFLVRTRADSGAREARRNDAARRDRAFASGAQLISTDFPESDRRFSEYRVRFEGEATWRRAPATR